MAKRKRKQSPIIKFLKIVAAIVIPAIIVLGIIFVGYFNHLFNKISTSDNGVNIDGEDKNIIEKLFEREERITVAGFGVDKDGMRTDSIVIGTYETKSGKIDLISVPRDTYIELDDEMYQKLNADGYAPRVMKINELHAYAGDDWYEYVIPKLEETLNIDINHYVKIDLDVFKKIVDLIGGVEFNVPMNMYYNDPYQNLYINLQKGMQTLDGDEAEMLIRYRKGYSNGDIGRVETQQQFMTAFLQQVLDWISITRIDDMVNAIYEDVETDLSMSDAIAYGAKYLMGLNLSNMETHIIPGDARYIDGRSYYVIDELQVKSFVADAISTEEKEIIEGDSHSANIEVLNGGSVNGLATEYKNKLVAEGYDVTSIGTYSGNRVDETRIIVSDEKLGSDLKQYFNDANIIVDSSRLNQGVDIQIIIGLQES